MTEEPVDAQHCPSCGGQWIDGRIAVPIVGSLRFAYRLGTTEVTTEVAAKMCENCGAVQLRARDPETIVRAQRAAAHGRARPWPARPKRPTDSTQEG
jgi:Zn-finger nucleic acid-binding protein